MWCYDRYVRTAIDNNLSHNSPKSLRRSGSSIVICVLVAHMSAAIVPTDGIEIFSISLGLAEIGRKVAPLEQDSFAYNVIWKKEAVGIYVASIICVVSIGWHSQVCSFLVCRVSRMPTTFVLQFVRAEAFLRWFVVGACTDLERPAVICRQV